MQAENKSLNQQIIYLKQSNSHLKNQVATLQQGMYALKEVISIATMPVPDHVVSMDHEVSMELKNMIKHLDKVKS